MDIPLPVAESKEEVNENDEQEEEEVEEEIDEEVEKDEEDRREEKREDFLGESGAETSESENVVVSPRHSRAKSALNVRREFF